MSGLGKFVSRAKLPLSGGLVLLLLLLQTLAVSPFLHHCVHDEASAPDHVCAVQTVAQGHLSLANPGSELPPAPPLFPFTILRAAPVLIASFFSVDSSRGPPSWAQ